MVKRIWNELGEIVGLLNVSDNPFKQTLKPGMPYQVFNSLLELSTPSFETGLVRLVSWKLFHACASTEPSIFAEHSFDGRPRTFCGARSEVKCIILWNIV